MMVHQGQPFWLELRGNPAIQNIGLLCPEEPPGSIKWQTEELTEELTEEVEMETPYPPYIRTVHVRSSILGHIWSCRRRYSCSHEHVQASWVTLLSPLMLRAKRTKFGAKMLHLTYKPGRGLLSFNLSLLTLQTVRCDTRLIYNKIAD